MWPEVTSWPQRPAPRLCEGGESRESACCSSTQVMIWRQREVSIRGDSIASSIQDVRRLHARTCARAASLGLACATSRVSRGCARLAPASRARARGFARALRTCSASSGCASHRLHARTCTLSASHGFTQLRVLRAARARLRPGCFAWLGACFECVTGRASRGFPRFAPALCVHLRARVRTRARLRAASHALRVVSRASRGFTRLVPASCGHLRTRGFAQLRAGFARAHLRTRGFARLRALRVTSRAYFARGLCARGLARLRALRRGWSRPQGGSF